MPGNVQPATPSGVLPKTFSSGHSEQLQLEALVNSYPDGSSERRALALNPRQFFKHTCIVTAAQWQEFRDFYRDHVGKAFYFYNLRETVPPFTHDPTGNNPVGRYLVVFDGPWSEELRMGRSAVSFNLREVV